MNLTSKYVTYIYIIITQRGVQASASDAHTFFNVSQWARNILDELFSKEYIQLPSTINLTRTTRFCDKSFFKSLKFHVLYVC